MFRSWPLVTWPIVALVACSGARPAPKESAPGIAFPMHLGEGHGDAALAEVAPSGSVATSAAPPAASAPKSFSPDPPDPTPLRQAEQYEYTLRYEQGAVRVLGIRAVKYPQPIVTARRVGRFAVELWVGHELIDRVRFDFPLLGADELKSGPRKLSDPPSLASGSFTATVLVPAALRARNARVVDRATRRQAELQWPPAPAELAPFVPM